MIERLVGTSRGSLPSMEVNADKAMEAIRASFKASGDGRNPKTFARDALPESLEDEIDSWQRAAALKPELDLATRLDQEGSHGPTHDAVHLTSTRVVRLSHSFRAVPALTALWSAMTYDGAVKAVHFVGESFGECRPGHGGFAGAGATRGAGARGQEPDHRSPDLSSFVSKDPRARARCQAVQSLLASLASTTEAYVPRVSVGQLDRIEGELAELNRRDVGRAQRSDEGGSGAQEQGIAGGAAGKGSGTSGAASVLAGSPIQSRPSETRAVAAAMLRHMAAKWPQNARFVASALRSQVPHMSEAAAPEDGDDEDVGGLDSSDTQETNAGTDADSKDKQDKFDAAAFIRRSQLEQQHIYGEPQRPEGRQRGSSGSSAMGKVEPGLPMLVCAVAGQATTLATKSKTNIEEVRVVVEIVARALKAPLRVWGGRAGQASGAGADAPAQLMNGSGDSMGDSLTVAVVTPYKGQRMEIERALRLRLGAKMASRVKVGTVDGVQGTEADLIVLSTVRTGDERNIGFLNNPRRTNVAISRARFGLAVVCDPRALLGDPFWCACVTYGAGLGCMVGTKSLRMVVQAPGNETSQCIRMVSRARQSRSSQGTVSEAVARAVLQPRAPPRLRIADEDDSAVDGRSSTAARTGKGSGHGGATHADPGAAPED